MAPKTNPIIEQAHPLEPLQEASLRANQLGHENTGVLLEAIIQQNEKNNPEPAIEANTAQSKKNTTEIIQAIKNLLPSLNIKGDGATITMEETNQILEKISKKLDEPCNTTIELKLK